MGVIAMANKIFCLKNNCANYAKSNLTALLVLPFEGTTDKIARLFSYFLHSAPCIDSKHSRIIRHDKHAAIFNQMMEGRHFLSQKFCHSNAPINKELASVFLDGNDLCLKCKRFVCKRQRPDSGIQETDLKCFLRHIRNAIAHGRVYYRHEGNRVHIVFEDENPKTHNLTARIVCIQADLEHWKKVLQNPDNYED